MSLKIKAQHFSAMSLAYEKLGDEIQKALDDSFDSNPEQFPCRPRVASTSHLSTWSDFKDDPPWPGEWDNRTNY